MRFGSAVASFCSVNASVLSSASFAGLTSAVAAEAVLLEPMEVHPCSHKGSPANSLADLEPLPGETSIQKIQRRTNQGLPRLPSFILFLGPSNFLLSLPHTLSESQKCRLVLCPFLFHFQILICLDSWNLSSVIVCLLCS
jgi:hypothetical protein